MCNCVSEIWLSSLGGVSRVGLRGQGVVPPQRGTATLAMAARRHSVPTSSARAPLPPGPHTHFCLHSSRRGLGLSLWLCPPFPAITGVSTLARACRPFPCLQREGHSRALPVLMEFSGFLVEVWGFCLCSGFEPWGCLVSKCPLVPRGPLALRPCPRMLSLTLGAV